MPEGRQTTPTTSTSNCNPHHFCPISTLGMRSCRRFEQNQGSVQVHINTNVLGYKISLCYTTEKMDVINVAEGIMEIVVHTGIPLELLSNQGSVFIGKVNLELCCLLNIVKLKTIAYHSQTNGVLEWWPSCKGCLGK